MSLNTFRLNYKEQELTLLTVWRGLSNLKALLLQSTSKFWMKCYKHICNQMLFWAYRQQGKYLWAKGEEGTDYQICEHMNVCQSSPKEFVSLSSQRFNGHTGVEDGALNLQKLELRTLYKAMSLEEFYPLWKDRLKTRKLICLNLGLGWWEKLGFTVVHLS